MSERIRRRGRHQAGFTMAEVLISGAILGIIATYLTVMLVEQSKTYEVVDEVLEAQQNVRALADLMERELRSTGMLVTEGAAVCGIDNDGNGSDVLFMTDANAVSTAGVNQAGLGILIGGGSYTGGTTDALALAATDLDGVPFYDNNFPLDGVQDSDFFHSGPPGSAGGGIIVVDRNNPSRGAHCGIVTGVAIGGGPGMVVNVNWTIPVGGVPYAPGNTAVLPAAPPGSGAPQLVAIPANVYLVDRTNPVSPRLTRNGMILADDVEDFQIAYFHDANTDGVQDPGEWSGVSAVVPGGPLPYTSLGTDNTDLRSVRFNIVARTSSQDPDVVANPAMAFGVTPLPENSGILAPVGGDGFRRRLFTRTVRPRNVGMRGATWSGGV